MNKALRMRNIMLYLNRVGLSNRRQIVAYIGHPRTTVFNSLHSLELLGFIGRIPMNNNRRGRPKIYWTVTGKGREFVESS